jgi:hypothetical protein
MPITNLNLTKRELDSLPPPENGKQQVRILLNVNRYSGGT